MGPAHELVLGPGLGPRADASRPEARQRDEPVGAEDPGARPPPVREHLRRAEAEEPCVARVDEGRERPARPPTGGPRRRRAARFRAAGDPLAASTNSAEWR